MQFEFANQESKDALLVLINKSVDMWKEEGHEGYEQLREAADLLRSAEVEKSIDVPEHLHHAMRSVIGAWEEVQRIEAMQEIIAMVVAAAERGNKTVH